MDNKFIKLTLISSILLIYIGCAQKDDTDYHLGQNPPGVTPEVFAPGIVSSSDHIEMGCTWAPDGKEFYFARSESLDIQSNWSIWVVREEGGKWSEPEIVSFSGVYRDFAPFITPDGKYMLFFRSFMIRLT